MSDIEIAQQNKMEVIEEVASKVGLETGDLELYGQHKAKLTHQAMRRLLQRADDTSKRGKLVLVTAMTPTPAGEGKSTVTIALGDGLSRLGKRAVVALREPSLGPCFGIKGGACGGGYAQVVPMEDINLHFTGDIHAVTASTNLIAALIDNHIHQGNALSLDPRAITWRRCVDLNDRALRNTVVGLGGRVDGVPREESFCISVASEIMAILCLSRSISELKERIAAITIGEDSAHQPVRFGELGYTGAVAALLKDALRPNLVQTLEKTPAFVHGGPFANIAHGCSSLAATLCALSLGEYVVTEAGFGSDLGAEKFFDIKCAMSGLVPSAAVIVATVRALKMHGGVAKSELTHEDVEALRRGFANLRVHVENVGKFGVPCVVAINRFECDTQTELDELVHLCEAIAVDAVVCEGYAKGGAGATSLAERVVALCDEPGSFKPLYSPSLPLAQKIECLATKIYRAARVEFDAKAAHKLASFEAQGWGALPVCVAKTQNSISHDKAALGAPSGYTFPVRDARLYSGAGFVVAFAGDIVDMPGLPRTPAAERIDVDDDGVISGLF